jgi:hypothetical protein
VIGGRWHVTSEDASLEAPILFLPDGVDNETYNVSDKVAEHRLSKGSFVNLHTVYGAYTYNCTVYVYSSPLGDVSRKNRVLEDLVNGFQSTPFVRFPQSSDGFTRFQEAQRALDLLRGKLLTLWTSKFGALVNYQLTGVDIVSSIANEWVFNLSFREVRYAELVFELLPTLPQAKKAEPKEECQTSVEDFVMSQVVDLLFPSQGLGDGILYRTLVEDGGQYIGTDGVPRSKAQGLFKSSLDAFGGAGVRTLEFAGLQ